MIPLAIITHLVAFGIGTFISTIVDLVRDRLRERERDRAREGRVVGAEEYYRHCVDCSIGGGGGGGET